MGNDKEKSALSQLEAIENSIIDFAGVNTQASEDFYGPGTLNMAWYQKLMAELPKPISYLEPFYTHKKEIKVDRTFEPPYEVAKQYYASTMTFKRTLPTGLPIVDSEDFTRDMVRAYQESTYAFLEGMLDDIIAQPMAANYLFKETLAGLIRDVTDIAKGSTDPLDLLIIEDTRSVQYRFPRSRKRRIRRKWAKDKRNWRQVSNGYNGPYELVNPFSGRKQILCSHKHYLELQERLRGVK